MIGRRILTLALVVLSVAGCSPAGLDFRSDERLVIDTPADRSTVVAPVSVRWTLSQQRDVEAAFAVLVDVTPPRPGAPLTDLLPPAQQDPLACDPTCQSEALAARGVYSTTGTHVDIDALPRPAGVSAEQARRHRITVIVLDAQGRRSGEIAASVDVDEETS